MTKGGLPADIESKSWRAYAKGAQENMDWFIQTFSSTSIAWLFFLTVVSLMSGFASSWLTYCFIKRRELIDIQKLESDKQKQERIRHEIIRWSNPVLSSVQSLRKQLKNILEEGGYLAMREDYKVSIFARNAPVIFTQSAPQIFTHDAPLCRG
jgi:hypothetical protein